MHCAKEGHKLNLIKANSSVCVEIETDVELISGGHIPCNYGSAFSSVVARGTINIPVSSEEKIHGLKLLMKHQTGKDFDINEQMADTVEVLKFVADSYSAKSRANSRTG
jgi:nitroimidazol reductase NimA-like FMN-containing flavoprotein (pyridoxamine 5'-phosphate oxidase superfamily)